MDGFNMFQLSPTFNSKQIQNKFKRDEQTLQANLPGGSFRTARAQGTPRILLAALDGLPARLPAFTMERMG